jgi:hypothetical protein
MIKKDQTKRRVLVLKIILFIIILGGSVFLLFFNPRLEIDKWQIDGTKLADESKMEKLIEIEMNKMWRPFCNNFFITLFRRNNLSKNILEHFPEIKTVNIRPSWDNNPFNRLDISIKEREKEGIWCSGDGECFYYDDTGFLFSKSADSKGPFIISIRDIASLDLYLGSVLGNKNFTPNLRELSESFSDIPNIVIDTIEVINLNYDFIVKTNNGWSLYFDPNISAKTQTEVFKGLLLEEKIKIEEPLQYIDLRIKNKAYLLR